MEKSTMMLSAINFAGSAMMAKYLCRKLFKAKSAMMASAIHFAGSI